MPRNSYVVTLPLVVGMLLVGFLVCSHAGAQSQACDAVMAVDYECTDPQIGCHQIVTGSQCGGNQGTEICREAAGAPAACCTILQGVLNAAYVGPCTTPCPTSKLTKPRLEDLGQAFSFEIAAAPASVSNTGTEERTVAVTKTSSNSPPASPATLRVVRSAPTQIQTTSASSNEVKRSRPTNMLKGVPSPSSTSLVSGARTQNASNVLVPPSNTPLVSDSQPQKALIAAGGGVK